MAEMRAPERFDKTAANYAVSPHHRAGRSLDRFVEMARPFAEARAMDLAPGSGHSTLGLAPRVGLVVACDPAPGMLEQVARTADERGVTNVRRVRGLAEALPFGGAQFDRATCRIAPHHFADIELALREMARVVKSGGLVTIADLCGYEDASVDDFNDRLERLHDPTHVRSYSAARWRAIFEQAGLRIVEQEEFREPEEGLLVRDWCKVAATPPENEAEIRRVCLSAPEAIRAVLGIVAEAGDVRLRQRRIVITAGEKPRA